MTTAYGKVNNTTCGACLRIIGSGILAHNAMFALEPGRIWALRFAGIRVADSEDPELDAIDRGVAFYDYAKVLLPLPDDKTLLVSIAPTVGAGRWVTNATISVGGGADIIAPVNARYFRPYVECYGDTPVTDIEVISATDITETVPT
jgi:hypothetical protein